MVVCMCVEHIHHKSKECVSEMRVVGRIGIRHEFAGDVALAWRRNQIFSVMFGSVALEVGSDTLLANIDQEWVSQRG